MFRSTFLLLSSLPGFSDSGSPRAAAAELERNDEPRRRCGCRSATRRQWKVRCTSSLCSPGVELTGNGGNPVTITFREPKTHRSDHPSGTVSAVLFDQPIPSGPERDSADGGGGRQRQ